MRRTSTKSSRLIEVGFVLQITGPDLRAANKTFPRVPVYVFFIPNTGPFKIRVTSLPDFLSLNPKPLTLATPKNFSTGCYL